MWLIDVRTLELKEFFGSRIPIYVILSHRWTDEEITFKDFLAKLKQHTRGYKKVRDFCAMVRKRFPWNWAWVDTVCIDKRSSAELSEAINSMFRWYHRAAACVVYLNDVSGIHKNGEWAFWGTNKSCPFRTRSVDLYESVTMHQFRQSEWFRRGWTLQELLAPRHVCFFTNAWREIGAKANEFDRGHGLGLNTVISDITGIPVTVLEGSTSIYKLSVAQRMSWLAVRTTTREEDIAYCALGLFRVALPLLYGEGSNAWLRLQQEISRVTYDETIFAWAWRSHKEMFAYEMPLRPQYYPTLFHSWSYTARRSERQTRGYREIIPQAQGLLGPKHLAFSDCGNVRVRKHITRLSYTITNQGIEFRLKALTAYVHTIYLAEQTTRTVFLVPLNCGLFDSGGQEQLSLCLVLLELGCGHFEQITPILDGFGLLAQFARAGCPIIWNDFLLAEDTTLYAHTTEAQHSCQDPYGNGHAVMQACEAAVAMILDAVLCKNGLDEHARRSKLPRVDEVSS